jgi:hypothetical protein
MEETVLGEIGLVAVGGDDGRDSIRRDSTGGDGW